MNRINLIVSALLLMGGATGWAQQQSTGGISEGMLEQFRKDYKPTAADKAIRNALNTTSISVLATNAENAAMIDTHFSDKVATKGITDQKRSGRCWLFTGLNVLRADAISSHNWPEFEFSQNYLFFYDQLEKCNLFLQAIIDTRKLPLEDRKVDWLLSNPLSDGGTFTGVANLVMKYGVVPSSVMPETLIANNTSAYASQMRELLRQDALELRKAKNESAASKLKVSMLSQIYTILCQCFGQPPLEFEWACYDAQDSLVSRKTYTPRSFYEEYVGLDLNHDYVMLMNDPSREYYKLYEIEYDRHLYDGDNWLYVNLPIERIKEMAIASIKDNKAMYFSCDVAKFLDREKGVLDLANFDYESLLGVDFTMDKKQRIQTHTSGSSHAMTLMAVDLDENGNSKKWMVENSWGRTNGYKGHLIMTDQWFDEYMFRLVVEKKFVPQDVLNILSDKPIKLPAWDPMFMGEE
ncbi:MAG TPA: aminopeptidase [Rikenellaceae bacterium]|nr:aminopeptidase [Rikenellaceae bacterium]